MTENTRKQIVILLICLAMILPLVIIGVYNRPAADDYNYGISTHQAIVDGGNIFSVIKAAWHTNMSFYNSWQGLYSSAFILSLQPAIWGESYYGLTTIIVLGIAYVCLLIGINILNRHYLKYSRFFSIVAALFALTFICLWLPSPAQGLYWFNGAMNYMPWVFIDFLTICLIIEIDKTQNKSKAVVLIAVTTILSFLTSGANHVTSFENILLLLFATVFLILREKKIFTIVPLIAACVGFRIMFVAPGTAARQAVLSQQSVIKTIIASFIQSFRIISDWISLVAILSLIVLTPIAIAVAKQTCNGNQVKFPLVPIFASYVIICGMLCVPYYAGIYFGTGRVTNVIWISFILFLWCNYFLIIRWIVGNKLLKVQLNFIDAGTKKLIRIVVPFLIICSFMFLTQNGTHNLSVRVAKELYNGTAEKYAAELDKRYDEYNSNKEFIEVEPIENKSNILFTDDISCDLTNWRNKSISEYYGKQIVLTQEENNE